jgi:uncharacterized phage protein gp47/JayE
MLIPKDFPSLNNDSAARLTAMGFTDAQFVGTPTRNILEAIDLHLADFYTAYQNDFAGLFISQASGSTLDALGLLLGCVRQSGEGDPAFRFRITQATTSTQAANLAALTASLIALDNVRDVVVRPYLYGIGTCGFYLVAITGAEVSSTTVELAQAVLDQWQACGAMSYVLQPVPVYANIIMSIASTDATAGSAAQAAITNWIASLSIGQPLILAKIIEVTIDAATTITDASFVSLSRTVLGKTETMLLEDYVPLFNQRIVPGAITVRRTA